MKSFNKKKVVLITQARTGSTRLPGKVLKKINGKTILEIHLERASKALLVDEIVVATTISTSDDIIEKICLSSGYKVFRGSEFDVLDRYYRAAIESKAEIVVRITSDCPLIDSQIIDRCIEEHIKNNVDFTSNIIFRTFPDGMDVEVFNFAALENAWIQARTKDEREHVTYFIWKNSNLLSKNKFTAYNVSLNSDSDYSNIRMTLDYIEDLNLIERLVKICGIECDFLEYINTINRLPELQQINFHRI